MLLRHTAGAAEDGPGLVAAVGLKGSGGNMHRRGVRLIISIARQPPDYSEAKAFRHLTAPILACFALTRLARAT